MGSLYINDFNKFGQTYRVIMQAESPFRSDLADLDHFYLKSANDTMVPLSTLVSTKPILGPDVSTRYNLFRSATVRASTTPGYSTGQAMTAMEDLADRVLPGGYTYEWTGMAFQEREAGQTAIFAYALALIFVYLFLVAQYESWCIPAAIILVVPLAIGGAVAGLRHTRVCLNL